MKKLLVIAAMLLAISAPLFAAEFPDVPADHWAYDSISTLAADGIIQGYPDGTFGGKRAMTRYEFAEALAKAIPAIKAQLSTAGVAGPQGPQGEVGPMGPAGPGNAEEVAALKKMVDEFKDELAALGVDVEGLRRDVAALNDRVTIIENEQKRVVVTGNANVFFVGGVQNSGVVFDKDSRLVKVAGSVDSSNVLANSAWYNDFDLNIKGRVSDNSSVNVLINAGNYADYALANNTQGLADFFTLWTMNLDTSMNFGPLGKSHVVLGRFPFQLTPLTLKFVNPDSYNYESKIGNGDFVLDGGRASFNFGPVALTAFAAKTDSIAQNIGGLIVPDAQIAGDNRAVAQLAGARAVIGIGADGNIGLTYYETGFAPGDGTMQVFGADANKQFGSIGLAGEYAKSEPTKGAGLKTDNQAWNANLKWASGNLGLGGGYTEVRRNYAAPGYWSDYGRAVNLQNVKGETANLSYAFGSKLNISGDAAFLQPQSKAFAVTARENTVQADNVAVAAGALHQVTSWKAGVKYALTAANSVDLGYENVTWDPTAAGKSTTEKYITFGIGHTFNPNTSIKLLYQIQEYEANVLNPYTDTTGSYRGGKAAAQVQMKF